MWEEVAQVHSSLTRKEIIIKSISILQAPYYKKLMGNATKNFFDMVISREMIDNAIKSDKISRRKSSRSTKKLITKDKKNQVNAISKSHAKFIQNPYPIPYMLYLGFDPYSSVP